jgi:hypothetical protein
MAIGALSGVVLLLRSFGGGLAYVHVLGSCPRSLWLVTLLLATLWAGRKDMIRASCSRSWPWAS